MTAPAILVAASALILLMLGTIHLVYTFLTNKFDPRDPVLKAQLKTVSPIISRQTTMWKAWIGFMLGLGPATLVAYLAVAKAYWFTIPLLGIALATVLYAVGVLALIFL